MGREDEGNLVKHARGAGLKQDTNHWEKSPQPPFVKGGILMKSKRR
jgi:hypothetical protein